jgi:hypothetical protein
MRKKKKKNVDWIHLNQDREQWREHGNEFIKGGDFLVELNDIHGI